MRVHGSTPQAPDGYLRMDGWMKGWESISAAKRISRSGGQVRQIKSFNVLLRTWKPKELSYKVLTSKLQLKCPPSELSTVMFCLCIRHQQTVNVFIIAWTRN